MTRKDYRALAEVMRTHLDGMDGNSDPLGQWASLCHAIADVLEADNARFVRSKFLLACGWTVAFGTTEGAVA